MRLSLFLSAAILTLAGCRCEPEPTDPGVGELGIVYALDGLMVTRANGVYDFQGIAMGSTRTLSVTVKNLGSGTLELTSLEQVSGDGTVFSIPFEAGNLGGGSSVSWPSTFMAPETADLQKPYGAHFKLSANGTGEHPNTADIEVKGIAVKAECALPDTIDFGGVAVGASERRSIHFENLTSLEEQGSLGTITSSNGDHLAFHYGPGWVEGPLLLQSGAMKDVTFTFTPSQAQTYSALVQLKAAQHCPSVTVKLVGMGVNQAIECSSLDFDFLPPQLTRSKDATLTNWSLQDVMLTALASSTADYAPSVTTLTVPAARRVDNGSGMVLEPGTATLPITFKPRGLGTLDATVSGTSSLMAQPTVACAVTGKGGGPDIELKPSGLLDVGAVPYFAGAPQPFFVTRKMTIQNLGVAPTPPDVRANLRLGVNGVGTQYFRVTPMNAATSVDEICVGVYDPSNPNPAARCSNAPPTSYDPQLGIQAVGSAALLDIPIRITPNATNKAMEWDVEVFSNDPDEPVVTLKVRAHSVMLPPCTFQLIPTSLQFGLVTPPSTKELSFSIRNMGPTPGDTCLITHLDLAPGADSTFTLRDGPVDQLTLAGGAALSVTVRATASGLATTTLRNVLAAVRFGISSPAFPQTDVQLSAFIGLACLTIAPSDLDFGTVKQGCDSDLHVFSVYNTCISPVTINGWRMAAPAGQPAMGPNCPLAAPCPEFLLEGNPSFSMGATIPPGAAMPSTFTLKYHPIDLGHDMGAFALDVTQNGARVDQLVTLQGTGDSEGLNTDTFAQDPRPKADILWVIDSSCSMRDEQLYLSQNFAAVIQYATNVVPGGIDYQMGVIDSDPATSTGGKLRGDLLNPKVLRYTTPNVDALFRAKVQVGTSGSGIEHFADLAVRALTAPLVNTDNAGFLRPDAVLAVIAVTDAGDQSQLPTSVIEGLLRNIKGAAKPSLFSYNVIGPFTPSTPPGCEYDDYTDLALHDELITALSGVKGQICNQQWAQTLQVIGRTAFGYRDRFFLSAQPDLTQMPIFTVKLNGINVPENDTTGAIVWSYDIPSNSVKFTSLYVPQPGETLTVSYHVVCHL